LLKDLEYIVYRHIIRSLFAATLLFCLTTYSPVLKGQVSQSSQTAASPWHVRAVIVATFKGEYDLWGEREGLTEAVAVPGVDGPLRANREHTILGMVSGTSLVNAAESMMALGLDPQFDLMYFR
jgi:purine nucleoside permease